MILKCLKLPATAGCLMKRPMILKAPPMKFFAVLKRAAWEILSIGLKIGSKTVIIKHKKNRKGSLKWTV